MLKKILIGLAALILVFCVVAAMQSSDFRVVRSARIDAPAPAVFAQINDLHKWEAWSPWAKKDPAMKQTYEGAPSGPGAVYTWSGNHDVGEGRMTILETRPDSLVRLKLEFLKPFAATNIVDFELRPEGNQTDVTWSMRGEKNFFSKAAGLVLNMDKMVGDDFEKGLAGLQAVTKAEQK